MSAINATKKNYAADTMSSPPADTRKAQVLVVDDTPENIAVLVAILKQHYELKVATCGQRALSICASHHPPDLVLLDVMMPGMDGFEVCRRLKQISNCRDTPVIFITALQDVCDEVEGFEAGAVDYIHKPVSPAIALARIKNHLQLQAARQFIRNVFGRYLSDEIVSLIIDTPGGLKLGGEMCEISVLMADLRGFTRISEMLNATCIVRMLNAYLDVMTEIIMRHKGTIEEFIGDGILATFGAPIALPEHALQAVYCAVDMQLAIPALNRKFMMMGLPQVEMGVGIHSGEAIMGNIGSGKRAKYGAVGQVVNIASRIESCTLGGQVLISDVTLQLCRGALEIRGSHQVKAKGISEPLILHDVAAVRWKQQYLSLPPLFLAALLPLPVPVDVDLLILKDKAVRLSVPSRIVAAGVSVLEVCCARPLKKLLDVEVMFHTTCHDGVYAKVVDVYPGEENRARLRITWSYLGVWSLLYQSWHEKFSKTTDTDSPGFMPRK